LILFVLLIVFLVGAACGHSFGGGRGALALVALLAVGLGVAVAAIGSGALLAAAYGGGPVLIVGGLGIALGVRFRPKK
jgi:hypothetical protein